MFLKQLTLALLLSTTPALAADLTDSEVLALVGPKTCQDGGFTDVMPRQLSIPIVTLDPNITYEYCFKLPKLRKSDVGTKTNGLVEFKTANLGNGTCGTVTTYLIRPDRKPLLAPYGSVRRTDADFNQVQPAAVLFYTPGVWRLLIRHEQGCNKYRLDILW